jgi:hypothetical protein
MFLNKINLSHRLYIPLSVFLITQLISFCFLAIHKSDQEAIPAKDEGQYYVQHHPANPPWDLYVSGWNGQAFREIATNGYPQELPLKANGAPSQSPWAFFPLFPTLAKVPMTMGLSFGYSAIIISLLAGFSALLILYSLVFNHTGKKWPSFLAVLAIGIYPAAPLFQLAYSEALALLLLILEMFFITKKKYILAAGAVLLLGLTRPVGIPDFLLILINGIILFFVGFRQQDKTFFKFINSNLREKLVWRYILLLVSSTVATVLWVLIGFIVTGENAYFKAHEAFYENKEYFMWFKAESILPTEGYPFGTVFLMALFLFLGLAVALNKDYPTIIREWPLLLMAYIFITTAPVGNEVRYLFLGLLLVPFTKIPQRSWHRFGYFAFLLVFIGVSLWLEWQWVSVHWVSTEGVFRKNV